MKPELVTAAMLHGLGLPTVNKMAGLIVEYGNVVEAVRASGLHGTRWSIIAFRAGAFVKTEERDFHEILGSLMRLRADDFIYDGRAAPL